MQPKIDFYKYLLPNTGSPEKAPETQEILERDERVFKELNKYENYYFRFAEESDLMRLHRTFRDHEAITTLAKCTKTLIGDIINSYKVLDEAQVAFNNHEFQVPRLLSKKFVLDILDFPEQLKGKDMQEAIAQYEKFIRSDKLIAQKKHLLSTIGHHYIIHYDPQRIVTYVRLDERK